MTAVVLDRNLFHLLKVKLYIKTSECPSKQQSAPSVLSVSITINQQMIVKVVIVYRLLFILIVKRCQFDIKNYMVLM